MAVFETWLKSDINKPVQVKALTGNLFSADNGGNLIGAEVVNNGQPVALTGGCIGYIIRGDGETVVVTGTVSGNRASILLPSSAYAVVGPISIVIKNDTTTVAACTGYVYRSTTEAIVDPGHVIPSLEDLLDQIDNMQEGTTAANNAASAANTAATETSRVDISMSKSGQIITITTTNRNGVNTSKTVREPTAVATKSGEVVTVTVTDANGTTSQTLTDPVTRLLLLADDIPGTTSSIVYDSERNVTGMLHKQNGSVFRTDTYTITDDTATEKRVLAAGGSLTMVTDLSTLETIVTYVAA